MVDARRALPAVPTAVSLGAVAAFAAPSDPAAVGLAAAAVTLVGTYHLVAGWSDADRRCLGYLTATWLGCACWGLVAAAGLLFAMLAPLAGSAGQDDATRLGVLLLVVATPAGAAVPALYAVADRITRR